jgi:Na+/H+ antiporter NhaA
VKKSDKFLIASSVTALLAVFLMSWSVLDPRPIPVLVAMSLGQGLGTISLVTYLMVVAADVRRRLHARASIPPPAPSSRHSL